MSRQLKSKVVKLFIAFAFVIAALGAEITAHRSGIQLGNFGAAYACEGNPGQCPCPGC